MLERAIALVPADPDPVFRLGVLLEDSAGDLAGAEWHFRAALDMQPRSVYSTALREGMAARLPAKCTQMEVYGLGVEVCVFVRSERLGLWLRLPRMTAPHLRMGL